MRIAVVGAGIIGVASAYELAASGHSVTVFERRGSAAAETSFANAGIVSPGYAAPWPLPTRAMRLSAPASPATWKWMWRWWRAGAAQGHRANRLRLHRLAAYSKERLHHLTHSLQLDYERSEGQLVLLRTAKDLATVQAKLALLKELGVRHALLTPAQCLQLEPGLNADTELQAGIHLMQDEIGNCRQFALLLREEAERLGASFCFHTTVQAITAGKAPRITKVYAPMEESTWISADVTRGDGPSTGVLPSEPETETFDAVLVCAALSAAELLKPCGLTLPFIPVHSYSVTAPLRQLEAHPELGPRSAVMDERHQVTISRFGARVRVAGGAELGGTLAKHHRASLDTLYTVLNDWFPGAAHTSQAQVWKGVTAVLPDGPPLLGTSGAPGIWLNLGHGANGWLLACGCARVVADQISGREAGIDIEGLGFERLSA